jgi:hypothetical protein
MTGVRPKDRRDGDKGEVQHRDEDGAGLLSRQNHPQYSKNCDRHIADKISGLRRPFAVWVQPPRKSGFDLLECTFCDDERIRAHKFQCAMCVPVACCNLVVGPVREFRPICRGQVSPSFIPASVDASSGITREGVWVVPHPKCQTVLRAENRNAGRTISVE